MVDGHRTQADGERKQVTVLFADVKGSLDMAEHQDPEQWRSIMQGFYSLLADDVKRFEGTVDKFTGDGVMAIFGAPVAHEDHARRACYAALKMLDDISEYAAELRRRHGLNFSTRVGINSGEVVAGAIGEGGDGAYTAIGHTVGLAQRMEALAEPGKAYLTEAAAELARGFFDLEDLGEFDIKGASRPVRVFELAGVGEARSRLDLSRERGFSAFVGREEELSILDRALERARAGEGAAVGIVADPGIGKSRLCYEFAQRCRATGIEVYEAQAQAHGREIPFMPVLQMLRAYFGISGDDPERSVREKIAGRALLLDPEFAEDLPFAFDFLGVPDPDRPLPQLSPEARQRALRQVVCRLVRAPNRREPIVAVIEDLHWIDEGSESLLGDLLGAIEGTPTLVIVNFRPEYEPTWTAPADYREIALRPLGPEHTRELVHDLAGDDESLAELAQMAHERTAGNPFFIEEIVRSLAESGHLEGRRGAYRLVRPLEDAGVPSTVQTVLASRIDRLPGEAKRLLQAASVAGKEVPERAILMVAGAADRAAADEALQTLIDAGFLFELELYPERVLAFKHPLTRDVAYGSQLADQRAATHAATARALIELNPERRDELAALIANHLELGGETLEAARWSARGAWWAGQGRPRDALRLWTAVSRLADELEEGEEALALAVASRLQRLTYSWRLGMPREEVAQIAEEAERIATRIGDIRSLTLLKSLAGAPGVPHRAEDWKRTAEEANRLAERSGDPHLRVAISAASSYVYLCTGDFDRFEECADTTLELAAGDRSTGAGIVLASPIAWALMSKGIVRRERREFDDAERWLAKALQVADEVGDPETASWIRGSIALVQAARGDAEAAVAMARRNCELTERLGDVFSRSLALSNYAQTLNSAAEHGAALEAIDQAESIYREAMGSGGELQAWRGAVRAVALNGVGRSEEAIEVAERAVDTARSHGILWPLPPALHALAEARAATGRDGVREALEEGAEVARETGTLVALVPIEEDLRTLAAA